jgi:peptide/nickel transport system ATP-binding protein
MSVFADEVAILFEGRVVERAEAARLFAAPAHPHTRALVAAVLSVPPLAEATATS